MAMCSISRTMTEAGSSLAKVLMIFLFMVGTAAFLKPRGGGGKNVSTLLANHRESFPYLEELGP